MLLRTAKGLIDAKVPARRITKALQALASQLPTDRPLSAVRVQIDGDRVIVRDNASSWEPESKQTVLDFSVRELGEKVAPLARESVQRALRAASTADDLFQAALESEEIGATARSRERVPQHDRGGSRRTSPRTSTWAGCGTSARRSTKPSGSIGARSSSSRTIRRRGST